ncbi:MAG: hypothetical protein K6U87_07465 [Firmicutes bacterium]|nr:hypothetical protein [Bacillota bacterium]
MQLETTTVSSIPDLATVKAWWQKAPPEAVLLGLLDTAQIGRNVPAQFQELLPAESWVFPEVEGKIPFLVYSQRHREWQTRREVERKALLRILEEAVLAVASQDVDHACRLAAQAYVNLKADPPGQSRFNGLLHRLTGASHRPSPTKG